MPWIIAVRSSGAIAWAAATSAAVGPGALAPGAGLVPDGGPALATGGALPPFICASACSTMPRHAASGGRIGKQRRQDRLRLVEIALLLRGDRQKEARLRRRGIERMRRLERGARLGRHDAAARHPQRLAEPRLPLGIRAEQPDGVLIGARRLLAASEAQIDRRQHLPAAARLPAVRRDASRPWRRAPPRRSASVGCSSRAASGSPGRPGAPSAR